MALAWKSQIHFELVEREIYLKLRLFFKSYNGEIQPMPALGLAHKY